MNKTLTICGAGLLALACSMTASAQTTQKLSANKANEYGLIYSLPLTALDITVEAERTVETPGEFYRYAQKYLSLDPVTATSQSWTIKSVTITPRGIADTDERYLVQFKGGSAPFMVINAEQFPLSVNTEEAFKQPESALPEAQPAKPTILELPVARQAITEEMLRSTSTPKRAELAAARILELRQNRSDIISGQADAMPSDGAAMKLALDNLNAQEQALTAMFTGTTQTSTEVETFTYVPDSLDTQRVIIARLSATQGLVSPDDLSGAPIYLDINVDDRATLPVNEKGETKRFPKGGLAYRIPGSATATVTFDGRTVARTEVALAQAGVVFGLDPAVFTDKKAPSAAIFNPVSGAIVELKPME